MRRYKRLVTRVQKFRQTIGSAPIVFAVFFALFLMSHEARAEGGSLDLGVVGGYATGVRIHNSRPGSVHGGGIGGHVTYNFDETWGIFLEGQFDWYRDYIVSVSPPVSAVDVSESGGAPEPGTNILAYVEKANSATLCLGVLYQVDVLHIIPYLAAGALGIRNDQIFNGASSGGYALGFRMALGADYNVLPYLNLGLALHNDLIFLGVSEFKSRLAAVARITFLLFPGRKTD